LRGWVIPAKAGISFPLLAAKAGHLSADRQETADKAMLKQAFISVFSFEKLRLPLVGLRPSNFSKCQNLIHLLSELIVCYISELFVGQGSSFEIKNLYLNRNSLG
jgi:hypothetical protein